METSSEHKLVLTEQMRVHLERNIQAYVDISAEQPPCSSTDGNSRQRSRKGQRCAHSKLSHEPAWKKVCFGNVSNVPRKGLCFVLGGGVPVEASSELKLFPISSSHIHMP